MKIFPSWIKKRLVQSDAARRIEDLLDGFNLHTVCRSACCPNKSECFSNKRVTFMILGDTCTRDCRFCAVKKGGAAVIDTLEPERISQAVRELGLNHAIITSVTRDDLEDGGAGQFYKTVCQIKRGSSKVSVEVLTPDFEGKEESLDEVLDSPLDIFGHNLETVPRLYNRIRPQAKYKRSLAILEKAKRKKRITKSGIMVGLGETKKEVYKVMHDLRNVGCELLTIGQYLRPTKKQIEVNEFVHPDVFDLYRERASSLGFKHVLSSPFARTSYITQEDIWLR